MSFKDKFFRKKKLAASISLALMGVSSLNISTVNATDLNIVITSGNGLPSKSSAIGAVGGGSSSMADRAGSVSLNPWIGNVSTDPQGNNWDQGTAVGFNSKVRGKQGTAIGFRTGSMSQGVAVGADSFAVGEGGIAIGGDDLLYGLDDSFKNTIYGLQLSDKVTRDIYMNPGGGKVSLSDSDFFKVDNQDDPNSFTSVYYNNRSYSPTLAGGRGAIALGARTVAVGDLSTSIGALSFALGDRSTALGINAFVDKSATGSTAVGDSAYAFAPNTLAVGNQSEATNEGTMAYGFKAKAVATNSLAIGNTSAAGAKFNGTTSAGLITAYNTLRSSNHDANAINAFSTAYSNVVSSNKDLPIDTTGDEKFSIGPKKISPSTAADNSGNAIVLGNSSFAVKKNSLAIGYQTLADAENGFALGSYAYTASSAANSIAFGVASYSGGANSFVAGSGATSDAANSVAIGYTANVLTGSNNSIAIGQGSKVESWANDSFVAGSNASTQAKTTIVIGNGSDIKSHAVTGNFVSGGVQSDVSAKSIVIGINSHIGDSTGDTAVLGSGVNVGKGSGASVVIGAGAYLGNGAYQSIVIGKEAKGQSKTINSIAIGEGAEIGNRLEDEETHNVIAFGQGTKALGLNSMAIGQGASVAGKNNTAFGTGSKVDAAGIENSMGLGNNTEVNLKNSVALGYRSTTKYYYNPALHGANTFGPQLTGTDASTQPGYVPPGSSYKLPVDNSAGVISVGGWTTDKNTVGLRRIINVSPGFLDTDVATVGQLRALYYANTEPNMVYYVQDGDNKVKLKLNANGTKFIPVNTQTGEPIQGATEYDLNDPKVKLGVKNPQGATIVTPGNTNGTAVTTLGDARIIGNVAEGVADNDAVNVKQLKEKLNRNADNFTPAGEAVIRNLAKGSVKVINGTNTTVEKGTEGDFTTYKVNVDLSPYATTANMNAELAKKANLDLGNINVDGKKVITGLNTKVAVDNTGLSISDATDANGTKTYTLGLDTATKNIIDNAASKKYVDDNKVSVAPKEGTAITVDKEGNVYKVGYNKETLKADLGVSNLDLKYKANGKNEQTTTLAAGLDFKNGTNTTATVAANGEVVFDVNPALKNITSITNDGTTLSIAGTGVSLNNKKLTGLADPTDNTDAATKKYVDDNKVSVAETPDTGISVTTSSDGKTYNVGFNSDKLSEANVKKLKDKLGVSDLNLSYGANNDGKKTTTLQTGLTFENGTNTTAVAEAGGKVKFDVNPALTGITSITSKDGSSLTFNANDIAVNNKILSGLTAGKNSSDAVNVSQLSPLATALGTKVDPTNGTVAEPKFTVDGDSNITTIQDALDKVSAKAGGKITFETANDQASGDPLKYAASLGSTVKLNVDASSKDALDINLAGNEFTFSIKENPTFNGTVKAINGFDANNKKIINVANGDQDHDAVNYSQLKPVLDALKTGAVINTNVTVAAPVAYAVKDNGTLTAIAEGIKDGETAADKKYYKLSDFKNGIVDKNATPIDINGKDVVISSLTKDAAVGTMSVTNVKAGRVEDTSTDAVNGSQLKVLSDVLGLDIKNDTSGNPTIIDKPTWKLGTYTFKGVNDVIKKVVTGQLGTVVVTDKEGNTLVRSKDNKFYKVSDVNVNTMEPNPGANPVDDNQVSMSVLNPVGDTDPITGVSGTNKKTTTPIQFNNVGSVYINAPTKTLTPAEADAAMEKILANNDVRQLNSAATAGDIQAVSLAGLNVLGNSDTSGTKDGKANSLHQNLGSKLAIEGKKDTSYNAANYSFDNVVTVAEPATAGTNNTIRIALAKAPNFDSVKLGADSTKAVSLTPGTNGEKLTLAGPTANGTNGKVVLDGLTSGTTDDSAVTLKQLNDLAARVQNQAGKKAPEPTMVYTLPDGTKLTRDDDKLYKTNDLANLVKVDGKFYKESDIDSSTGKPKPSAPEQKPTPLTEEEVKTVTVATVNPDGSTTLATPLSNVKSALKLANVHDDAKTNTAITAEQAKAAITDGTDGLLAKTGAELNKAATVGDLQALAQAGLDFTANSDNAGANDNGKNTIHKTLGTAITIQGGTNNTYTAANYSGDNVVTYADKANGIINIALKNTPTFTGVELSKDGNKVSLAPSAANTLKLSGTNPTDPVKLTGLADGAADPDAVNYKQLKEVKDLADKLDKAINGGDGGSGDAGTGTGGTTIPGPAGKDGLDGKNLNEKINAIRGGEAGSMVYTDKDGNRLVREGDNFYKADETKGKTYDPKSKQWYDNDQYKDGKLKDDAKPSATQPKELGQNDPVIVSAVNGKDGSTKTPTSIGNVASGLDLANTTGENAAAPKKIDADAAQKAIAGNDKDGNGGLLNMAGPALNRVATVGDLQAVAQAGLDFASNNAKDADPNGKAQSFHTALGSKVTIIGKDGAQYDANAYSADNLITTVNSNRIQVAMLNAPTFDKVTLGKDNAAISLTPEAGKPADGSTPATPPALKLGDKDSKPVQLKGIADGNEGTDAVNKGQLDAAVNGLKDALGVNGTDGNTPSTGAAGKDGLDGKNINEKINAIRNGQAGTMVYTDKKGDRLTSIDGKLYPVDSVKVNGKVYPKDQLDPAGQPKPDAKEATEVPATDAIISAVSPDGATTTPVTLGNLASALGLPTDAVKATAPINEENAKKAINGKDGLLSKQGADLGRAATLADLQAVAQAGLDFASNNAKDTDPKGKEQSFHTALGSKVTIIGKDGAQYDANAYSADNLITTVTDGKIQIAMLNTPSFKGVELNDGTNKAITLTPTAGKDGAPAVSLAGPKGTDGKATPVEIKGVAPGTSDDSATTKGQVDKLLNDLKDALGVNGTDGATPSTGAAGKDGLDGKNLNEKINALRGGEAGSMVYTNKEGDRVVREGDNFYKASETAGKKYDPTTKQWYDNDQYKDGKLIDKAKPSAIQPTALDTNKDPLIISAVNPDGTTTKPVTLGNLASALGLPTDATTAKAPINEADAKKAINGTDGLLSKQGADLGRAATLADLQAVAQAGLDFGANSGDAVHRTLGTKISILGGVDSKDYKEADFDSSNIVTVAGKDNITIAMKKAPNFDKVELGKDKEGKPVITLTPEPGKPAGPDGTPATPPSLNLGDKDGKPVELKGVAPGTTPDSVATKGQVDDIIKALGLDGKDGAAGTDGPAGKDGLNGKTIVEKIDALRNGAAGPMVYTDKDGNRLTPIDGKLYPEGSVKGKDGKVYPAGSLDKDGNPKADAKEAKEVPAKDAQLTAVSPDGSTTTPTALGNLESALGVPTDKDAKAITPKDAKDAINGKDGKDGLLGMKGADLGRAATVGDLQAVAQAGIDFDANTGDAVHRPLGSTLSIKGGTAYDAAKFSTENLSTFTDPKTNSINIAFSKAPTFDSVKLGDNKTDVTVNKNGDLVVGDKVFKNYINVVGESGDTIKVALGDTLKITGDNPNTTTESKLNANVTAGSGNNGSTAPRRPRRALPDDANATTAPAEGNNTSAAAPTATTNGNEAGTVKVSVSPTPVFNKIALTDKIPVTKDALNDPNSTILKPNELTMKNDKGDLSITPEAISITNPKEKVTAPDGKEVPAGVTITNSGITVNNNKDPKDYAPNELVTKQFVDGTINDSVNQLKGQMNQGQRKSYAGIAAAMAAATIPDNQDFNDLYTFGFGAGTYHGEQAFAIGLAGTTPTRKFSYKLTGTVDSTGTYGAAVGLSVHYGRNHNEALVSANPEINSKFAALQKKAEEFRKASEETINSLKAQNEALKERQDKMAEENAQLRQAIENIQAMLAEKKA